MYLLVYEIPKWFIYIQKSTSNILVYFVAVMFLVKKSVNKNILSHKKCLITARSEVVWRTIKIKTEVAASFHQKTMRLKEHCG